MNLNRVLKYFFGPNKRNILFFLLLGISAAFLFDRGFALFSLAQADNAVLIKIDSATSAKPGDSIDLNLSIDPSGSSKQPASIQWDINYNSGQISSITWKGDGQAIKDAGKSASCSALSAGVFRCVVFGLNTNTITKGTLGTVTVKLSNAATGPVIDLKFSGLSASDPDGSALPMSASDGTITLQTVVNNTPPTVAIVSPAAGVTASGSNVILSATASAASGSISNVKFYLDTNILLGTVTESPYALSWDSKSVANGAHVLMAQAVDSQGNIGHSVAISFNVNNNAVAQPVCQYSGDSTININQVIRFVASGGNGQYAWAAAGGNPASQAESSSSSFYTAFGAAGSYAVQLISGGQTVACPQIVVVTQTQDLSCSVSPSPAQINSSVVFTANGGDGQNFVWTVSGGSVTSFNGKTFNTIFSNPGNYTATVLSGGKTANCILVVQQPSYPNLSCTASSANVNVNTTVSFAANGGSAPYSWTGGGFPTSGNGNNFSTVYPSAGNKTVQVTSGDGQTAQCGVVVNVPVCEPNINSSITASAPVKHGSFYTVNLSWSSSGEHQIKIIQSGGSSATVVSAGSASGSQEVGNLLPGHSYTFQMSDVSCGQLLSTVSVNIPEANPNLSCTASFANVNVNTTVSFAASGGSAPYSWTGGGFPTSGNGNNFSTVYPSAGNKTVQVTSGDGQTAQCGVVVNMPETNPNLSCTASSANVNVNQAVVFSATGGLGSYTWNGNGIPAAGSGGSFVTYYPSAGNKTVQVTSGDGQTAQCGVVVNSSPGGQCFISGNFAINFLPAVWNGTNFSVTVSWTSTNSNQIKITQDGSASVVGSGTSGGTIRVDNLVPGSSHTFYMYDLACGMLLTSNTVIIPQAPSNNNPNPNPNPVPPVYNNPQVNNITVNSCVNYSCNYNYYSVNNTGSTINNPPVLFPSQPTIPNSDWVNNLTSFLSQNKGGFIPPMPWFPFNN